MPLADPKKSGAISGVTDNVADGVVGYVTEALEESAMSDAGVSASATETLKGKKAKKNIFRRATRKVGKMFNNTPSKSAAL
jgi:hypothetical protein